MEFNQDLEDYLNENKSKLDDLLIVQDVLGEGVAGVALSAEVKPRGKFPMVVLKEMDSKKYCTNERNALNLLTKLKKEGQISNYFINLYADIVSGSNNYLILEKADVRFDELFTPRNGTTTEFLTIFWQLSQAVKELEAIEMNHGDLWVENVMLTEIDGYHHVRIIDFDAAFKEKSIINKPAVGGADYHRTSFVLGYDLNRFFDSVLHSYHSYTKRKLADKKRRIAKAKRLQKLGKDVEIPKLDVQDSDDEEWDELNVDYPADIVTFMEELGVQDPNCFDPMPNLSGETVQKKIEELADKLQIDIVKK